MTARTLPGWLPAANLVVRAFAKLGLSTGTIQVLTVPGRRTGKPRSTPVSLMRSHGRLYVVAAQTTGDWARNVRAAGHGELGSGRRRTAVRLPEVTDPDEKRAVLRAFPREVPAGVPFYIRLGLVTRADPDQFAAIADRVAAFRIES